ncbi:MAG TPA: helicase-related protein [Alphaproteobacteria bacterium]|nr:helicase-related protein [Alphaproteobacteria bacterium]
MTAVLGPTNTGKTFLAVERMLGHASGMIGFPLRLLARENYDRIVALKGVRAAALVTGEEKIVPSSARYFVCTVESMPLDRRVSFLAIDEVQLAADPERGHIFTDRLLHARGLEETMFLGADTIRPLLRRLVPEARFESRPRFSTLEYTGPKKLIRLPRRSAVVAFSAAAVYALAELIRRRRGGAAVVLGALSPRTRNAQVAMYEAGEVDYLVATDAIGMGLNMDVDHVAFAELAKFDGRRPRRLDPAEIAQIAGRAGRHMNDGSFGTTGEAGEIAPEVVDAVENHRFEPLLRLCWRNRDLSFRSVGHLLQDLDARPPTPMLVRKRDADDHLALTALTRDPDIRKLAQGPAAVRLLWEVCQIPDFRKILTEAHTRLLAQVFRHLMRPAGVLPEEWVARQVERLNDDRGDIDALTQRISHIRTWTYIAHRGDWLTDSVGWQARARMIEDRLSDALHDRLTQRFVDRRQAVLQRRLNEGGPLLAAVTRKDEVLVEGQYVGRLEGFHFAPEALESQVRPVLAAARRAVAQTLPSRLRSLETEPDSTFALQSDGKLTWRGGPVARLAPGSSALEPRVDPLPTEFLDANAREQLRLRLNRFVAAELERTLGPLLRLANTEQAGAERGMIYRLQQSLGTLRREDAEDLLAVLDRQARRRLSRLGLRIGREHLWISGVLGPAAVRMRALLWSLQLRQPTPELPRAGRKLMQVQASLPEEFYRAIGYRRVGAYAFRVDAFESLSEAVHALARQGPFMVTARLAALAGGSRALAAALVELGARAEPQADGATFYRLRPRAAWSRSRRRRTRHRPDSPFASLGALWSGR